MVEGAPPEARDFVEPWMGIARPALDQVRSQAAASDLLARCEEAVIGLSLANLNTFPWIAEAVAAGRLALHGFRFAIRTGVLLHLEGGTFVPVD
jgi:carbonic anhydrase